VTTTESNLKSHLLIKRASEIKNRYFPGVCVAITIGIAASFLSQHYSAPAMLMALLLGMAFNFLRDDEACLPGIEFSSKTLLRIGVALLGLRITLSDVMILGWQSVLMICSGVILTIGFGILIARLFGFSRWFGVLTGGSVAICGASAALAISSVLPNTEAAKRETLFAVIAVTTLSTIAMVAYPAISLSLGLTPQQSGLFIGGTIHDVAQVVGAGYSISNETGDLSTFVKLLRVAMLVPIVLVIGVFVRRYAADPTEKKSATIPLFLIGFVLLFILNSFEFISEGTKNFVVSGSSWLLLTAVAALGVKTSLKEILNVGWRPVVLVISETVFIAIWVMSGILFL
jgi:uncharacterized integral membrane protein (TIGR00698 family)